MPIFRRVIMGNVFCTFCSTLKYERVATFDKADRRNQKAHTKSSNALTGVKLINFITDNRTRVYEKESKIFSNIRFCPICGFDYVKQRQYDGQYYVAMDLNKLYEKDKKGRK